jgi:CubicO group peptidase (beta-lactamase class C family)|tara:strand:+ start:757 stop:2103 length:1347 start_codon:yes stop_codon:yes gene_type:complete
LEKIIVEGSVAPNFESLRDLFVKNIQQLAENSAQLCVYVGDQKVVDLWARAPVNSAFNADSLINVFSSGKNLEVIAMASLVDRGLLDYNAKVVTYWPEFGAHGKDQLSVADVMRHEAGLAAFDTSLNAKDLHREQIRNNAIGRVIESQTQNFRAAGKENAREYHALTRGWVVNEIFRRVDPEQRTIGEFLRDDIAGPLGVDAMIGVPEEDLPRIAKVKAIGFLAHLKHSLMPQILGRKVHHSIFAILGRGLKIISARRNNPGIKRPAPFARLQSTEGIKEPLAALCEVFNDPLIEMGETPSANAHCSARGLAKIASALSRNGVSEGTQILSAQACQALHEAPIDRSLGLMDTQFTQGGVALFAPTKTNASAMEKSLNHGREGFYGWMGLGGSIFQWHPEYQIGFAFVPTSLHVLDLVNERGKAFQAEVLRIVEEARNGQSVKAEVGIG